MSARRMAPKEPIAWRHSRATAHASIAALKLKRSSVSPSLFMAPRILAANSQRSAPSQAPSVAVRAAASNCNADAWPSSESSKARLHSVPRQQAPKAALKPTTSRRKPKPPLRRGSRARRKSATAWYHLTPLPNAFTAALQVTQLACALLPPMPNSINKADCSHRLAFSQALTTAPADTESARTPLSAASAANKCDAKSQRLSQAAAAALKVTMPGASLDSRTNLTSRNAQAHC
mmetsp:Transcript_113426/g.321000  ORF Transcript_113426/g.321000 Transcript_113426/m.321000 type:complete len:234 (+) Transcript_113426:396-1097(+)